MMVVTGIVMECNPFHEGHQYILDAARYTSNADYVVVVLSGDYVQRGIPAILSKEERTRKALDAGADLVLELPLSYATGAANYFANGAMQILTSLHVVTDLAFGSQCADPDALRRAAMLLEKEPPSYQQLLRSLLAQGLSYPAASQKAAEDTMGISLPTNGNDILGIEYVRALNNSSFAPQIKIHAIPRITTDSATVHRARMLQEQQGRSSGVTNNAFAGSSSATMQGTTKDVTAPYYMSVNDFSAPLYYELLHLTGLSGISDIKEAAATLMAYQDVDHDLACRIIRLLPEFTTWEDYAARLKTRNVTYARISRALLHILLHIRKDDMTSLKDAGTIGYARILGMRRTSGPLLSAIREKASIPLITSPRAGISNTSIPEIHRRALCRDLASSELYDQTRQQHQGGIHTAVCELAKPIILL